MNLRDHAQTVGYALHRWLVAQTYDSIAVGAMWLMGLWVIGVPWAPAWALAAAVFQFIPHLGSVLGLMGPAVVAGLSGGWTRFFLVLALYAVVAVTDGLVLQPYLMKRVARIPFWASLATPIVLGILLPFWGVLLSPPLLAVVYGFRAKKQAPANGEPDNLAGPNPLDI